MRKFILALLVSLLMPTSFALQKLTVALDWFPNPDHAPLIVAKAENYFQQQGLDVEFITPSDPNDAPKWVAAGKVDLGVTYEPKFMEQVDQGLPLISVGTLIDRPLDCLIVLKKTGITQLSDLKGKRIGHGSGGLSSIMLKTILKHAGIEANQIQLINLHYNLTQALLSGKVDAVSGIMRNIEIPQIEALGETVIPFLPEDNGIPTYSTLIFVSHLQTKQDPRFTKFFIALKKAVRYIDEHPKQSWDDFTYAYPESNNTINRQAWFATMPYFAEQPTEFDNSEWLAFAKFMQKNSMIKTVQPIQRYIYQAQS